MRLFYFHRAALNCWCTSSQNGALVATGCLHICQVKIPDFPEERKEERKEEQRCEKVAGHKGRTEERRARINEDLRKEKERTQFIKEGRKNIRKEDTKRKEENKGTRKEGGMKQ
ncbi:hypothetical protein ATANTOWER_000702 [Ataeniobius toweri]|uniref:Uncharacterized protein n=1 Tax=Ataeniobius toweri TaxID=208326 RepID=A0ABU7BDI6_9TELE|nr:hypothetical protein [Ataeniobius toweri]